MPVPVVRKAVEDWVQDSIAGFEFLMATLAPIPQEWLDGVKPGSKDGSNEHLECLPCEDYKTLINAWRKAMKWTDGLDRALSVMLASMASTPCVGDQLWVKIIGPASCGKSTLSEAVSVNRKHVVAKSTIRGFFSGFDDGDGQDNSLFAKLGNRTLIIKDGDTLLQSPNLPQILSEARDIYDTTSRSDYRNKQGRDYVGQRMTFILCGTSSLRTIDSSELGERFLDCVIMESIEHELEDEVLLRVVNRADRNLALEADGSIASNYEPEMAHAMQLTGGYVSHLRNNVAEAMAVIDLDDSTKYMLTRLGKFVAMMRARPSKMQDENAEREFSARLVSQLTRLSKCLAFVLNANTVSSEVMRRVKQVALDTARGQTLQIASAIYESEEGLEARAVTMAANTTDERARKLLRFLRAIGVVEPFMLTTGEGLLKGKQRWRLTPYMQRLYESVMTVE